MRSLRPTAPLLLAAALTAPAAGCGGGDDDFEAPSCAAGEVAVEGTVDGREESISASGASSYVFVNALGEDNGTLTMTFAAGTLRLEWPELVADGDSVEARGIVAFGASYGNCEDDGFPGTMVMDDSGGGGRFRLTSLRPGGCESAAVDGELVGCFKSPN